MITGHDKSSQLENNGPPFEESKLTQKQTYKHNSLLRGLKTFFSRSKNMQPKIQIQKDAESLVSEENIEDWEIIDLNQSIITINSELEKYLLSTPSTSQSSFEDASFKLEDDLEFEKSNWKKLIENNQSKLNIDSSIYRNLLEDCIEYKVDVLFENDHGKKLYTTIRKDKEFEYLVANLRKKYVGYIIPALPSSKKKSGSADQRKIEKLNFLDECLQHDFLKMTPELEVFFTSKKYLKGLEEDTNVSEKFRKMIAYVIENLANLWTQVPYCEELAILDKDLWKSENDSRTLKDFLKKSSGILKIYQQNERKKAETINLMGEKFKEILRKKEEGNNSTSTQIGAMSSRVADVSDLDKKNLEDFQHKLKVILNRLQAICNSLQDLNEEIKNVKELNMGNRKMESSESKVCGEKTSLLTNEKNEASPEQKKIELGYCEETILEEARRNLKSEVQLALEKINADRERLFAGFGKNLAQNLLKVYDSSKNEI